MKRLNGEFLYEESSINIHPESNANSEMSKINSIGQNIRSHNVNKKLIKRITNNHEENSNLVVKLPNDYNNTRNNQKQKPASNKTIGVLV